MMGVKSLWILSVDRLHARPHPDPAWRLGCESCDLRDREVGGPRSKEGELWSLGQRLTLSFTYKSDPGQVASLHMPLLPHLGTRSPNSTDLMGVCKIKSNTMDKALRTA